MTRGKGLINMDSSKEAKNVYNYICSIYGNAIISGQQESAWGIVNAEDEIDYIKNNTGKLPAIRGLDFIQYEGVTKRAINWWEKGGIPSICWHWGAPTLGVGYEASKLEIDINEALTPGTTLNIAMMADMDRTAIELTKLRDANVPILWRPFHEFNGGWFWWGKGGAENFKKLWKLMYDYYTNKYKLNNLIWVLGFTSEADKEWYPGDDYVDIAGADTYSEGTQNKMFKELTEFINPSIPLCYHECGPIPDPDSMILDGTKWTWFLTWHTIHIKTQNTVEYINKVYNHKYVITLDEVPNLK